MPLGAGRRPDLLSAEKRVEREVRLTPMHSAADYSQELSVEVLLNRKALVRREDSDAVNFAGLHHGGVIVGVQVCSVADVAIERRVFVDGVPQCTAFTHVAGEQYLHAAVECDVGRRSPSTRTPAVLWSRTESSFGVKCSAVLGTSAAMREALHDRRFVDGQMSDVTALDVDRCDDVSVQRVLVRNRIRLALYVGHHQASSPRIFGERHFCNLCHGFPCVEGSYAHPAGCDFHMIQLYKHCVKDSESTSV